MKVDRKIDWHYFSWFFIYLTFIYRDIFVHSEQISLFLARSTFTPVSLPPPLYIPSLFHSFFLPLLLLSSYHFFLKHIHRRVWRNWLFTPLFERSLLLLLLFLFKSSRQCLMQLSNSLTYSYVLTGPCTWRADPRDCVLQQGTVTYIRANNHDSIFNFNSPHYMLSSLSSLLPMDSF